MTEETDHLRWFAEKQKNETDLLRWIAERREKEAEIFKEEIWRAVNSLHKEGKLGEIFSKEQRRPAVANNRDDLIAGVIIDLGASLPPKLLRELGEWAIEQSKLG